MFHQVRVLCLLACVAGWSAPGLAQPVYRCSDNSYSNQPCPGGKEIQAQDPRTAAQRAQTADAARRDAKAADEMEKSRLKQEAKVTKDAKDAAPLPVADAPRETASADRTYSPFRAKKPQYFTAVSPRKGDAKVTKSAKKKTKKKAKAQAS
jgi:hypothetical protein